jgi:hypothetical protein
MISYEDLCRSLDIYNRKLRGEEIPEEAYQEQAIDDDFDIVDSADMGIEVEGAEMDGQYAEAIPDVTAETAIPPADFGGYEQSGSGEVAQGGYDSGAVPEQPAEGVSSEQYSSEQYSSEQPPPQEGYEQVPEQPYEEGHEQAPEQQAGVYPDDQDPNRQQ